jgi:fructose-specific phosphotransferase system IIC component
VIPVCVLGSAVAGGLSMFWHIGLQAPHGGVFVLAIPNAVNHVLLYAAAIAAGTVVTALGLGLVKREVAAPRWPDGGLKPPAAQAGAASPCAGVCASAWAKTWRATARPLSAAGKPA